jgi:hypothetical protein
MPNRFTAVPTEPVPAPGHVAAALAPIADIFMIAMLSRPPSGTLRTTWVTPATLWLAVASGIAALAAGVLLVAAVAGGAANALLIGAVACGVFAIGAGSVVVISVDQRRRKVTSKHRPEPCAGFPAGGEGQERADPLSGRFLIASPAAMASITSGAGHGNSGTVGDVTTRRCSIRV